MSVKVAQHGGGQGPGDEALAGQGLDGVEGDGADALGDLVQRYLPAVVHLTPGHVTHPGVRGLEAQQGIADKLVPRPCKLRLGHIPLGHLEHLLDGQVDDLPGPFRLGGDAYLGVYVATKADGPRNSRG